MQRGREPGHRQKTPNIEKILRNIERCQTFPDIDRRIGSNLLFALNIENRPSPAPRPAGRPAGRPFVPPSVCPSVRPWSVRPPARASLRPICLSVGHRKMAVGYRKPEFNVVVVMGLKLMSAGNISATSEFNARPFSDTHAGVAEHRPCCRQLEGSAGSEASAKRFHQTSNPETSFRARQEAPKTQAGPIAAVMVSPIFRKQVSGLRISVRSKPCNLSTSHPF